MQRRGFTLVEMIVVLAIIGISIGVFYSVLFVNWTSFEKQVSLIDMQMDADMALERIAFDGKIADSFTVDVDNKGVTLYLPDNSTPYYSFTSGGTLNRFCAVTNNTIVVTRQINYNNSFFNRTGEYFTVYLGMQSDILGRPVTLNTTTQIVPRNNAG